jgi:hypothetical protein
LQKCDHNIVFCENANFSPKIGKNWQKLAKIGKNWQKMAKIGKNWQKLAKIAENCQKLQKIVNITSTPGANVSNFRDFRSFSAKHRRFS